MDALGNSTTYDTRTADADRFGGGDLLASMTDANGNTTRYSTTASAGG
jgi:hypothetical protein